MSKLILFSIVTFTFALASVTFGVNLSPNSSKKVSVTQYSQSTPMDEEEPHHDCGDDAGCDSTDASFVFIDSLFSWTTFLKVSFHSENTHSLYGWTPSPEHRPPSI